MRRRELAPRSFETAQGYVREPVDISHVFHGRGIDPERPVKIVAEGVPDLTFTVEPRGQQALLDEPDGLGEPKVLYLLAKRWSEPIERGEVMENGLLVDERLRRSRAVRPRTDDTVFITPDSMTATALTNLYNEVIVSAAEGQLVEALRLLDPKVSGVYFLASDRGAAIDGGGGILIGRNGSERYPIGSYGDGMRRLLALAMAFVNTRSGVLLVDEVDTGLHYSVMQDLWKLILGTTSSLSIQAFATTHSLDCVRGLHLAIEENPDMAERVAVHKIDSRLKHSVTFTGQSLVQALKSDLELR